MGGFNRDRVRRSVRAKAGRDNRVGRLSSRARADQAVVPDAHRRFRDERDWNAGHTAVDWRSRRPTSDWPGGNWGISG